MHWNNETFLSIWSISCLITSFEWFEHWLPYFSIHFFSATSTISYTLGMMMIDSGILRWQWGKWWSGAWTIESWLLTLGILCFDETIIWSWARHLLSVWTHFDRGWQHSILTNKPIQYHSFKSQFSNLTWNISVCIVTLLRMVQTIICSIISE